MRASFEDIRTRKGSNSYLAYTYSVPRFPFHWHYHPEYELTLILSGTGRRMVGDSYEHFYPGDLVLIGPDLPHTWVGDNETMIQSAAVVVQFSGSFIDSFFQHPECDRIRKLLTQAGTGLYFSMAPRAPFLDEIKRLPQQKGLDRITGLLHILNQLSSRIHVPLASPYFQPSRSRKSEDRINKVCQYIQGHNSEVLPLKLMADLVHLSESAFCKFFKRTTGKTFSDYVCEVRIGHACQMLLESEKAIADIAYESGFDSLTYFNRVFLRKKGIRPGEFRRMNG